MSTQSEIEKLEAEVNATGEAYRTKVANLIALAKAALAATIPNTGFPPHQKVK
jgi:hypothetical protein